MNMRWYIVHAYSNFEKKVADSIREQASQRGLSEKFEEILVPTEQVVEMRRGRKINSERKFFPGYVLVKCDLTDEVYHLIKNTPKVTGFLGADKKPMPIPDLEADRIKGQVARRRRAAESGDPVRDRRKRAGGGRAVRIVQRDRRGSRRIPFAGQGRRVDLRPRNPGRSGVRAGGEGVGPQAALAVRLAQAGCAIPSRLAPLLPSARSPGLAPMNRPVHSHDCSRKLQVRRQLAETSE